MGAAPFVVFGWAHERHFEHELTRVLSPLTLTTRRGSPLVFTRASDSARDHRRDDDGISTEEVSHGY
jgi:hypothetical protein